MSKVTGHVYEKDLIEKYIRSVQRLRGLSLVLIPPTSADRDNEGRDPITGSTLTEDDLLPIKTCKPRCSACLFYLSMPLHGLVVHTQDDILPKI